MATKYWVVDKTQLSSLDYDQLKDDSKASTRLSVNGLKAIIESDEIPTGLNKNDSLAHSEALTLMATSEWYQPDPNDEVGLD